MPGHTCSISASGGISEQYDAELFAFYYNPSSSAAIILGRGLVFGILPVKLHSHQCQWGNYLFLCLKNSAGF